MFLKNGTLTFLLIMVQKYKHRPKMGVIVENKVVHFLMKHGQSINQSINQYFIFQLNRA